MTKKPMKRFFNIICYVCFPSKIYIMLNTNPV